MFYIGKHVSPSIPPVLVDEKIINDVLISCAGDGFGGQSWHEYGKFIDSLEPNKLVRFRDYFTGKVVIINSNFIVKAREKKVLVVESDVTQNDNFHHKKTIDYWLMETDAEYQLVDKCNVTVREEDARNIKRDYIY